MRLSKLGVALGRLMSRLLLLWLEPASIDLHMALGVVGSGAKLILARLHLHVVVAEPVHVSDHERTCDLLVWV